MPEIEKIVRDYLMREPEVIYEAIQELQKPADRGGGAQKATIAKADEIPVTRRTRLPALRTVMSRWSSSSTICGYRRSTLAILRTLVDTDDRLRFVFKELPVLGPDGRGRQGGAGSGEARSRQVLRFPHSIDADKRSEPDLGARPCGGQGLRSRRHVRRDGRRPGCRSA